jgi:hypothetical protein
MRGMGESAKISLERNSNGTEIVTGAQASRLWKQKAKEHRQDACAPGSMRTCRGIGEQLSVRSCPDKIPVLPRIIFRL